MAKKRKKTVSKAKAASPAKCCQRLNPRAFGLACGILWGLVMFVMTLVALGHGVYGVAFLNLMASIYPGYAVTGWGVIVGAIYGFLDGYIGGYIFIWLYNKLA